MIVLAVLVPVLVLFVHRRVKRRQESRRVGQIDGGLASAIDLIVVVLGAGGTVHEAVGTVARFGPPPIAAVFGEVRDRSAAGMLLGDAIALAYDQLTPAFHPLIGTLASAERDGGPISVLLHRLADEAEQARRLQAESLAKRLPVALLIPLVTCLLPSVVVGALVPVAVVAIRQLAQ